jgi:hypothetical protein
LTGTNSPRIWHDTAQDCADGIRSYVYLLDKVGMRFSHLLHLTVEADPDKHRH